MVSDSTASSWDAQDKESGAILESGNMNGENIYRESQSHLSSTRSNENRTLATPKKLILQKLKRYEIEAKAVAHAISLLL